MKSWEILAAATALIAGFANHLRSVMRWMTGLVLVSRSVDHSVAAALCGYIAAHGKITTRERRYFASVDFVRPLKRTTYIAHESRSGAQNMYFYKRRPLWSHMPAKADDDQFKHKFYYIRGTVDFEQLVGDAIAWYGADFGSGYRVQRYRVYHHHGVALALDKDDKPRTDKGESTYSTRTSTRIVGWKPHELGEQIHIQPFESYVLTPSTRPLAEEVERWVKTKPWFDEHGVPWRRGYLLHGIPGTGKTSLVRAIAEANDLPVHVFDLASMSNQDLRNAWQKMIATAPCIALIEDIDAVFSGRDRVTQPGLLTGGLTFDTLLNCVDGVQASPGVLFFVTTNHIEQVDAALRDRPGRIDRVVELGPLDRAARQKIAERILGPYGRTFADTSDDQSAAAFTEVCARLALERKFAETPTETRPELELCRQVEAP